MGGQGPGDRGRHRAHQRRARPDRAGAHVVQLRGRGRGTDQGHGTRRGPVRVSSRCPRVPQPAPRRAAERQLRRHARAPVPVRPLAPARAAGARAVDGRARGRDRREGRQGSDLPRRAILGLGDPPRRRHRRVASPHAGRDRRALALRGRDVPGGRRRDRAGRGRHRARRARAAGAVGRRGRCRARRGDARASAGGLRAEGRQAGPAHRAPRATCSPRCSSCSARIPTRGGERR